MRPKRRSSTRSANEMSLLCQRRIRRPTARAVESAISGRTKEPFPLPAILLYLRRRDAYRGVARWSRSVQSQNSPSARPPGARGVFMEKSMNRRSIIGASAMTLLGFASVTRQAAAEDKTLKQQLIGAWILTSIYDQTTDGKKHELWGPGVQGSLMLSPTGRFSLMIMAANREKASPNPQNPVGPALAYFGFYTVDEGAKTFTYHVENSTFPQWIGTARTATVQSLTADELQVAQAIVHDPVMGDLVPHFGWKRANPA